MASSGVTTFHICFRGLSQHTKIRQMITHRLCASESHSKYSQMHSKLCTSTQRSTPRQVDTYKVFSTQQEAEVYVSVRQQTMCGLCGHVYRGNIREQQAMNELLLSEQLSATGGELVNTTHLITNKHTTSTTHSGVPSTKPAG